MSNIHLHDKAVLCFVIVLILSSCKKEQFKESLYGTDFNIYRKEIGLIPLDPQWQSLPQKNDMIWWHPANIDSLKKTSKAFYGAKMMKVKNDTLMYEVDVFVIYNPNDPVPIFMLSYMYVFFEYELRSVGWEYFIDTRLGSQDEYGSHIYKGRTMSKNEADSILSLWELKYR